MSDTSLRAFLPTPLHLRTAELCATNAWVEHCGFTVPALYTSLREEQEALIARVALSDLSARQCWTVQGPDAAAFLSTATVNDVRHLEPGQTQRTLWCDDAGFVRGEGLIVRFAKTEFELWTTVGDFAWFADATLGFDVKVANATGTRAIIGVRGPSTQTLLATAGLSGEPANAGDVVRSSWRPAQVTLMHDTSGAGMELCMQADDGVVVWDRLWRTGAGLGIAVIGAQTLEILRLENGVALAGADWQPAQFARPPSSPRVPSELGFAPDLTRRFNGAEALRRMKPPQGQILTQLMSDEPLAISAVTLRGAIVGRLTSQAWSHARAATVALGWLDRDAAKPGAKVTVQGPNGPARAEIVRALFDKPQI